MGMFWCLLVIALMNTVVGWLARRYPNIIAGYNTMSREQKKSVDIDGLSRFMQRLLYLSGFGALALYLLMWWLVGEGEVASFTAMAFFGAVILSGVIYAQKFDSKSKIGRIWRK